MYLTLPPYLRVPHTKLRISAHPLRIETGRYNLPAPLSVEERVCWFCTEEPIVEDELHFLFNCHSYAQERQEFTEHCKLLNKAFHYLTNIDKWKFISHTTNNLLFQQIHFCSTREKEINAFNCHHFSSRFCLHFCSDYWASWPLLI